MNRCVLGLLASAILAWSFCTPAAASVIFESKLREADVKRLHGIGPNALDQLRRALHAKGLSFAIGE